MPGIQDIFGWAMSGEGRLVAAALLFAVMFALERAPYIKGWLARDSGWLTAKRKKLAANILLTMGPTALLLTTDAPLREVLATALTAALSAAGINAKMNAALSKPKTTKVT